jgi:hypothetical protein
MASVAKQRIELLSLSRLHLCLILSVLDTSSIIRCIRTGPNLHGATCCLGRRKAPHQHQRLCCQIALRDHQNRMWQCGIHYGCPKWLSTKNQQLTSIHRISQQLTNIIRIQPPESDLKIMICVNLRQKPIKQPLAFLFAHIINTPYMTTNWIDALPASDWIRADNWMLCLQFRPNILHGSSRLGIKLLSQLGCDLAEYRLLKCDAQCLEESLDGNTDAIVNLVPRSPKRISTCLGQLGQPQTREISWDLLKCDIRMPLCATSCLLCIAFTVVEPLLLHRADGANLQIIASFLAAFRVEKGMDVQARGFRTTGKFSKAQDEVFLDVVGEVVLSTEEDDAAFGDYLVLLALD